MDRHSFWSSVRWKGYWSDPQRGLATPPQHQRPLPHQSPGYLCSPQPFAQPHSPLVHVLCAADSPPKTLSVCPAAPGTGKGPTCSRVVSSKGRGKAFFPRRASESSSRLPCSSVPVSSARLQCATKTPKDDLITKCPSWPGAGGLVLDFVSIPSAREQTPSIPTVGLGRGRSYCEARLWGVSAVALR